MRESRRSSRGTPHDGGVNPAPLRLAARGALCDKRDGSRRRTISGGSVTGSPPDLRSGRRGAAFARRWPILSCAGAERGFPAAVVFPAVALVVAGRGEGGIP